MKIDMRNANIGQMTAGDVVHQYFSNVQNKFEVISGLDGVRVQLYKEAEAGKIPKSTSDFAQEKISEATLEAKSPKPNASRVRQLLDAAAEAIKGTVAVAGLFEALKKGTELLIAML
jgi:hypothetical protein